MEGEDLALRQQRQQAWQKALLEVLREKSAAERVAVEKVLALLRQARGDILALLADQPADWQVLHLTQVLAQIDTILAGATTAAAAVAVEELAGMWVLGQAVVDNPLQAIGSHTALLPLQDLRILQAMQHFVRGRFKDLDHAAHDEIDRALSLALLGGQTPQEAIRQVAAAIGPKSLARATTIVHTEMGRTFAIASHERLKQSARLHPHLKKVWRRSEKPNSRENHDLIDGVAVPVNEPFKVPNPKGGIDLMMHPKDPEAPIGQVINCGCVLLSWDERLGPPPGAKPYSQRELERNPKKAERDRMAKAMGLRQEPLPGADKAWDIQERLQTYSMNFNHPSGKHKARKIQAALGYGPGDEAQLAAAIREAVLKTPAVPNLKDKQWGDKYVVDVYITGPNGRQEVLRTAWLIPHGEQAPKMTTAYIRDDADKRHHTKEPKS